MYSCINKLILTNRFLFTVVESCVQLNAKDLQHMEAGSTESVQQTAEAGSGLSKFKTNQHELFVINKL